MLPILPDPLSLYAGELPGVAMGSSEALFIDKYAVQKIPIVDTNGCHDVSLSLER